jgi:4-diphosphocytidyl-2C-methyl-D-erythritol kinase
LINDLEEPAARVGALLADDRARLADLGLPAFLLSGSGGSWFVPVLQDAADELAGRIRAAWPERGLWVTRPVACGWRWLAEPEHDQW